ncbi:alpha/beta fold hydrolase [Salipiger mangrovisoli]|uniref:Alpha/beta fold hydrolase n=1 Tax=Salipiger mangrovisoli TaxID=2865933 RepID=A0ABR9X456_9RHOB|nr:alpha/beta fold hydrolase [Salipiger mangrovisoli]MBE9638344.1 alpha/beta fold hydrolase [Salipiger mangrovisoli]
MAGPGIGSPGLGSRLALDLRGRDLSDSERFYVEDIADSVADLRGLLQIARSRHPDVPLFVLGHSAGGVICCTYALDHPDEIDGFIRESFAFQVPAPGVVLSAVRGLSHLARKLGVLTLKRKDFTCDPEALHVLEADPLTKDERQPAATVAALVLSGERLHDSFARIALPVLILHGTEDRATVCRGSEFFLTNAGSKDKTLKLYDGHFHDLLNDIGKEQVLGDIVGWIEARLPDGSPRQQGAGTGQTRGEKRGGLLAVAQAGSKRRIKFARFRTVRRAHARRRNFTVDRIPLNARH